LPTHDPQKPEPYEDVEDEAEEEFVLVALRRLRSVIEHANWFHRLGQPMGEDTRRMAEDFVSQLGFPDAWVASVADWEHAAIAAENPDINSDSWEAEEQQRIHLTNEAAIAFGEDRLQDALEAITATAGPIIFDAAANVAVMWGVEDDAIVEAAAGSALQACYNAALVIASEEEESHPFALKFALFEAGHWPVGIAGQTFNIF